MSFLPLLRLCVRQPVHVPLVYTNCSASLNCLNLRLSIISFLRQCLIGLTELQLNSDNPSGSLVEPPGKCPKNPCLTCALSRRLIEISAESVCNGLRLCLG